MCWGWFVPIVHIKRSSGHTKHPALRSGVPSETKSSPRIQQGYHTRSYADQLRRAKRLASALQRWGVRMEDAVPCRAWRVRHIKTTPRFDVLTWMGRVGEDLGGLLTCLVVFCERSAARTALFRQRFQRGEGFRLFLEAAWEGCSYYISWWAYHVSRLQVDDQQSDSPSTL